MLNTQQTKPTVPKLLQVNNFVWKQPNMKRKKKKKSIYWKPVPFAKNINLSVTICQTHQRYWLPKDHFFVVSLYSMDTFETVPFYFFNGRREGRVIRWEGPLPPPPPTAQGYERLALALAEKSELTLCSSRQRSGASPFLTCMRSLLPFTSHNLHGSDTSIAPPRACCGPTKIWGSTGNGETEADLIPPMA